MRSAVRCEFSHTVCMAKFASHPVQTRTGGIFAAASGSDRTAVHTCAIPSCANCTIALRYAIKLGVSLILHWHPQRIAYGSVNCRGCVCDAGTGCEFAAFTHSHKCEPDLIRQKTSKEKAHQTCGCNLANMSMKYCKRLSRHVAASLIFWMSVHAEINSLDICPTVVASKTGSVIKERSWLLIRCEFVKTTTTHFISLVRTCASHTLQSILCAPCGHVTCPLHYGIPYVDRRRNSVFLLHCFDT